MRLLLLQILLITFLTITSCKTNDMANNKTAAQILGNPEYPAICYGGYRENTREITPTLQQVKEDLLILSALNYKIIRTYNVHLPEIEVILQAITELEKANPDFEMYVMLGAWIDCKNAWTNQPTDHFQESERNAIEIAEAVRLTQKYPNIIKIIAVGNEAMVKWATNYYVQPNVILKWVKHLQDQKKAGKLSKDLWITSSDNFASWGGGTPDYHVEALNQLIKAVDYISVHTYPMHDTHYNPSFWGILEEEKNLSKKEQIEKAMVRSVEYAVNQVKSVENYMKSLGVNKPIHIGETGWATSCHDLYGSRGSKATDEYKSARYFHLINEWCNQNKMSCFYFEAFDEQWKDTKHPQGSENHFGLINLQSQAKYAWWQMVDKGVFKGLTRDGKPITKTFNGNEEVLLNEVALPNTLQLELAQP
jgi:exo-beta-1,3-glucanase (GH17 family)